MFITFKDVNMDAHTFIQHFETQDSFSDDDILQFQTNLELRLDLIDYFKQHANRKFAIALLEHLIQMRKNNNLFGDHLMLGCFILGMNGKVEDCLKIWEAKTVDFDSYCYIDIELFLFAGVSKTVAFLQTQDCPEAAKALERANTHNNAEGEAEIKRYYRELPWWVYTNET